jgi:hypothetical protein
MCCICFSVKSLSFLSSFQTDWPPSLQPAHTPDGNYTLFTLTLKIDAACPHKHWYQPTRLHGSTMQSPVSCFSTWCHQELLLTAVVTSAHTAGRPNCVSNCTACWALSSGCVTCAFGSGVVSIIIVMCVGFFVCVTTAVCHFLLLLHHVCGWLADCGLC